VSRQVLAGIVALATAADRVHAARELASILGCDEVLMFVPDAELGVALPAPGFPRTLPDGRRWNSFLRECTPRSVRQSQAMVPGSSHLVDITAATGDDGTIIVLVGGSPEGQSIALMVEILPLMAAAFRGEHMAQAARAQTVIAEQSASNARSLAGALDHLRRDLQHALSEAEEALQARDEFFSVASHELKTPLTGLMLQVQMIQRAARRLSDPTPEVQQVLSLVGAMELSLRRLTTLTNDLLDVSRITAGRLDIRRESMDLSELANTVVARFADEAENRNCRLMVEATDVVAGYWDPSRLDQVLTNLVANALAYGDESDIVVRILGVPREARIEVQDHGPGIAPENQERIFHRFERASSNGDGNSLGLGLHITLQIVEAHGGRISLESEEGSGSTFIVDLPYGD
jgi:signal transduction histidine kinase